MALVAKSYQNSLQIGEVFTVGKKDYIKIETPSGEIKQVRAYSEEEYEKYYGAVPDEKPPVNRKEILGFKNGFITIFKGDTYSCKDWFKKHGAKYTRYWGWGFAGQAPSELPEGVEPIRLEWDSVAFDEDNLKPVDKIKEVVDSLIYDESPSKFVGAVGQRIEVEVTVVKTIPIDGFYGTTILHNMMDEDGNVYVWFTSSRCWEEGTYHRIRGTVKEHKAYKGVNQTVLTRCKDLNKEEK